MKGERALAVAVMRWWWLVVARDASEASRHRAYREMCDACRKLARK